MQLWKLKSPRICSRQASVPEKWWCRSSPRAGWGEADVSVHVWRQEKNNTQARAVRQREIPSSSAFLFSLFYSDLHLIGCNPIKEGIKEGKICSTHFTNSNINFIQKHPHKHTQNNVGPNIWAPYGESRWHIKLTIRRYQKDFVLITSSLW